MTVVVLLASPLLPWTPILESCGQFSKMREGRATGTPLLLWATLRLLLRFTTILRRFRPSRYRLQSLLSKLCCSSFLSSLICSVSFREKCLLLVSPLPNSSFMQETPSCLRRCFSAVTEQMILREDH